MMTTTARDMTALLAAVIEDMPAKTHLVYVDRGDGLTREQIGNLVAGDIDSLSTSLWDWEGEAQWISACDDVDELASDVIDRWEREDDTEYPDLRGEWQSSSERDSALDTIRERDESDVLGDLAGQSGRVLLRMPIDGLDEDSALDDVTAMEWLAHADLPLTTTNLTLAQEILSETGYPGAVRMGYVLAAVDVDDVYRLPFDNGARVTIHNPHVYYGNPFAGSGHAAGPFDGTVTYKRGDLTTDRDAFGYGWEEIASPYLPAYDCKITATDDNDKGE